MLILRRLMLFIVLSYAHWGMAQNFVWNKVVGDSGRDVCNGVFKSVNKKHFYVWANSYTGNAADTAKITINNQQYKGDTLANNWLIKFDTSGTNPVAIQKMTGYSFLAVVTDDSIGNVYIALSIDLSSFKDSFQIMEDAPYVQTNASLRSNLFILKMDSNLNFMKQLVFKNAYSYLKPQSFKLVNDNLYFGLRYIYNLDTINGKELKNGQFLASLDRNLSVNSFKSIKIQSVYRSLLIQSVIPINEDIQLVCTAQLPDSIAGISTGIDTKNYSLFNLYFKKANFDSIELEILTDTNRHNFISYADAFLFNNKMYLSTSIEDSIFFKNEKKIFNKNSQPVILIFENGNFVKQVIISESPADNFTGNFLMAETDSSFIYAGGSSSGEVTVFGKRTTRYDGNNFVMKIDTLGNVLWFFRTGDSSGYLPMKGFGIDQNKALYFGGTFFNQQKINNQIYSSTNSSRDFLLSKIYDFSITRGAVSKGPYCAGDTFLIPYTKDGTFADTNTFVAELSDEEGNFTGNHRVLGKLKTNKDSTIKGVLPLFDVVSSANYRIRIISTAPLVQSYYRYDSLRLLIYSKDTAYIGKDTQLCLNKPMQLKVTGGTAWRWSPGVLVNDSLSRTPLLIGLQATQTLRAIIADSSGCGQQDTAYITIAVFDKLIVKNTDTTLCPNSSLAASINGGDNNNYIYRWLDIDSNKVIGNAAQITANWQGTKNIQLLVTDSCFTQADSQRFKVSIYDSIRIQNSKDTSICSGFPYAVYANITGGGNVFLVNFAGEAANANPYIISNKTDSLIKLTVQGVCNFIDTATLHFSLYDKWQAPKGLQDTLLCQGQLLSISNSPQSGQFKNTPVWSFGNTTITADTLKQIFAQNETIVFSAQNQCGINYKDTFLLSLRDALKIKGPKDTTVCRGGLVNFIYSVSGGLNPKMALYNQNWQGEKIHGAIIDTTLLLQDSVLFLVAYDDCTAQNDTLKTSIYYFDTLKTKITVNPFCYKDSAVFSSNTTGGKPATNAQHTWDLNGTDVGFSPSLTLQNIPYQNHQLILTVQDNCSANATDTLLFHPNPKARLVVNNTSQCFGNQDFVFANTSQYILQDSVKMQWQFPANWQQDSSKANKTYGKFSAAGNYIITLKTTAKNGCQDSAITFVTVKTSDGISVLYTRSKNNNNQSSDWDFKAIGIDIKNINWYIDGHEYLNNPKAVHTFADTGRFTIRITYIDRFGCNNDTSFAIYVLHDLQFYIPTGISANADKLNDVFNFIGKEYVAKYNIKIFNRWGEMMFKSSDVNEVWQPKSNTSENYIYLINITDVFNVDHQLHGTIVVVK